MKKRGILQTFYYYSVSIFLLVGIVVLALNFYNIYNNYLQSIDDLETKTIERNKILLKTEVDIFNKYINQSRLNLSKNLKLNIKSNVDNVHNIATNLYNKYKNHPHMKNIIMESLREHRYNNGRDYIFMSGMDGRVILLPDFPSLEGKNLLKASSKKIIVLAAKLINIAKIEKEGFYE